jgi:predicted HAD superfamily phosphohydrolase|tara:strand:- start:1293 stop:1610 length:318 start_codon:yes stop_codon:yes gene_type:complete
METPNFEYINKLSRGDDAVKKMLVDIIKSEFSQEKEEYFKSFNEKNFKKIEQNVHKLKHKISILGLEKSCSLANLYEHNLRDKSIDGSNDFEKILEIITNFTETL